MAPSLGSLLLLSCATLVISAPSEVRPLGRSHAHFVAWLAGPNGSIADGVRLAQSRRVALLEAHAAGDYADVVAAARSLASAATSTPLDPALAAEVPDSWVSTIAHVDVAICMPSSPITAASHMHIERSVTLGGDEAGAGGTTLPMIAYGDNAVRWMTSFDFVPIQGAVVGGVFVVDDALVACDDAVRPVSVPSNRSGSVDNHAGRGGGGPAGAGPLPLPISFIEYGLRCVVGGVASTFSSAGAAHTAADHLLTLGKLTRMARFNLRPAERIAARASRVLRRGGHPLSRLLSTNTTSSSSGRGGGGAWEGSVGHHHRALFINAATGASSSSSEGQGRKLFAPASMTTGARTVLAVRICFSDQTPATCIAAADAAIIMANVSANFLRMSYGAMTVNLNLPSTLIVLSGTSAASQPSASAIMSATQAAVTSLTGLVATNFQHFIVLMPK